MCANEPCLLPGTKEALDPSVRSTYSSPMRTRSDFRHSRRTLDTPEALKVQRNTRYCYLSAGQKYAGISTSWLGATTLTSHTATAVDLPFAQYANRRPSGLKTTESTSSETAGIFLIGSPDV